VIFWKGFALYLEDEFG